MVQHMGRFVEMTIRLANGMQPGALVGWESALQTERLAGDPPGRLGRLMPPGS